MIRRHHIPTLLCVAFLFVLPLTLFFSVTLGNATLLPADNLFSWEPFRSLAGAWGVTAPQNHLLSDLILENYAWKRFIIESIQQRELPLWNPYLFAGVPFLAAGQSSAFYPLSLLYYILPIEKAYGWFTVANLGLAGVFMFIYMRALGVKRSGAIFAGVVYQFSGFMIVSVVFPMIIASAAWLPLILTMVEKVLRQSNGLRGQRSTTPWVIIGAIAIAFHIFAGHIEITVYTGLITALYCVWRLGTVWRATKSFHILIRPVIWLAVMAILGAGIGAIQLVPLYEVLQTSFRAARSSLEEVMKYGFPIRHILLWLMPNFYGNPAHHTYFDLFSLAVQPITTPNGHTDWGIKNYVEGGAYVGIITLVLAFIAITSYAHNLIQLRQKQTTVQVIPDIQLVLDQSRPTGFFIILGLLSVGFIFGTPLYAILYYGLPGINQLNSPFRWVYALTACLAILAGFGLGQIVESAETVKASSDTRVDRSRQIAWLGIICGSVLLLATLGLRLAWPWMEALIQRVYVSLAKATEGFQSVRVFFSYEARNVAILAGLLITIGVLFLSSPGLRRRWWWGAAVIGLLVIDLNIAWVGFNPSVDARLLQVKPDAIGFLQSQPGQWRFATYDPTGLKLANANAAWLYGVQDIRGYDSIIPKQYVDYMKLIEPQNELQYNRIAPLTQPQSLESPLTDLLNVRYVMTHISVSIGTPGFTPVYTDSAVRIYENHNAMPRAFVLPASSALLTRDFAKQVQSNDPRQYVMIDAGCGITDTGCVVPHAAGYSPATITIYRNNEVWIDAVVTQTSWLILADSYYPGWHAFLRPLGASDKEEHEVQIALANGNFRAVRLDSMNTSRPGATLGQLPLSTKPTMDATGTSLPVAYTVRFKYSPDSLRTGAFISFLALAVIVLMAGIYLWRLFYHEGMTSSPIQRVAKNSLVLTSFNLAGRLIDFAFAILMLRVLGPEGVGKFAFAVVIIGWFDILMNFGLNTFLTREVAKDRVHANKYLYNTTVLRILLGFGTAPLVILIIVIWRFAFDLASDTATVIILLAVSQLVSSMAAGLSALFFAYEKAEVPATLSVVSALISVSLRAAALLAGFGIIGLAGASIATNLATFLILFTITVRTLFVPHRESDTSMRRGMLRESFPLMLNHLLATLFFKVDVPLLEAIKSPTVVGWYSAAYKFVDAFNIIPAFFTQSIFPVMSRMAKQDDNAMARSYILSLKLLVMVALPIAVLTTYLAPYMIGLLGGAEFLPHGAIALMIMVWSIPFGWINSITNYALIAVNQQRALTRAFIIGLTFNIAMNLILIPLFSYQAAAVVTILSEIVEGAAFYYYVHRHIVHVPWHKVFLRPGLAAMVMAGVIYISSTLSLLIPGVIIGALVYLLLLVATHSLSPIDLVMLAPLIPSRLKTRRQQTEKTA